jgi:hypothetical protein
MFTVQYDVYLYNLISMMIVEILLSQCSYWLKFGSPSIGLFSNQICPLANRSRSGIWEGPNSILCKEFRAADIKWSSKRWNNTHKLDFKTHEGTRKTARFALSNPRLAFLADGRNVGLQLSFRMRLDLVDRVWMTWWIVCGYLRRTPYISGCSLAHRAIWSFSGWPTLHAPHG